MRINDTPPKEQLRELLESQYFGVLSTQQAGQPYASLMAFATTDTLDKILFLTSKTTRKYDNLIACPQSAMLIHNSQNQASDLVEGICVTATGITTPPGEQSRDESGRLFLAKHPQMEAFMALPSTALMCLTVDRYILVSRFQDVVEIPMGGNG